VEIKRLLAKLRENVGVFAQLNGSSSGIADNSVGKLSRHFRRVHSAHRPRGLKRWLSEETRNCCAGNIVTKAAFHVMSNWAPQGQQSIAWWIGALFRVRSEGATIERFPERWVELIQSLNELERDDGRESGQLEQG